MLPIVAEFGLSGRGIQPNLVAKKPSQTFSNTQNYWAASIITQLSAYCSVVRLLTKLAIGLLSMILQSRITSLLLCGG
ncbi:hypothetical protein [Microcoleus sp. Pol12B5]|uniref:hypothetical protein n=1 Tax=Microcoleus sp. Pol12B5 TaxID=3055396 RepID=UPI002FD14CB9